jgi:hypothetical protein
MNLQEIYNIHSDSFLSVVLNEVKKLAEEKPDFLYAPQNIGVKCFYNKGSALGPECDGCIIGQALQRLGWDDKKEMEFFGAVDDLFLAHISSYLQNTSCCELKQIQMKQDNGVVWGKCV